MKSLNTLFVALLAGELASSLAAQTPNYVPQSERRGMASRWPAAVLLQGSLTDGILIKGPTDAVDAAGNLTPPTPPIAPASDVADWRLSSLGLPPDIEIDAFSSGNAIIADFDEDGVPDLTGTNAWLGITVSVSSTSLGAPTGPFHNVSNSNGRGAELATYYFQASTGIAGDLRGALVSETNPAQFGLEPQRDIAGLDYGIGFWNRVPALAEAVLFTEHTHFYFSVTASWAAANQVLHNFAYRESANTYHPPHGGTIYCMVFTPGAAGAGTWSDPYVYAHAADLGLDKAGFAGDLDALDVDQVRRHVIFSAKAGTHYDPSKIEGDPNQLMIVKLTPTSINRRYEAGPPASDKKPRALRDRVNGTLVVVGSPLTLGDGPTPSGLGSPEDEVDALCTIDPESNVACSNAGINVNQILGASPMGMSIVRSEPYNGQGEVRHMIQVTGWGDSTPGPEWLVLYRRNAQLPASVDIGSSGWGRPIALQQRFAHETQWTFDVLSPPTEPGTAPQGVTYIAFGATLNPLTFHSSSFATIILQ